MTLKSRLIFGTARLAGGACAGRSRQLIESCLDAGIAAFDTAPSYGMGAAEGLLGEVCGDLPAIALHTKAGSPRPRHPAMLGWIKHVRNLFPRGEAALPQHLRGHAGPAHGFDYEAPAMSASLARSQTLLRRECIDLVLLHEAEPCQVPASAWNVLESARNLGIAKTIGYAHYGPPGQPVAGLVVQVAPRPDDFARTSGGPRVWHSVRLAADLALRDAGAGAAAITQAGHDYGLDIADATDRLVAGLVALARADGEARMIFATSDTARLCRFLSRLEAMTASKGIDG